MGGSTGGKPPAPGPRAPVDGAASGPSRELPETDYNAYLEIYGGKTVPFRFRGRDLRFTLSLGLFSSADIDRGTRLLLKVLSRLLDEGGASPPRRILDCGCGAGIIGVCAARALLPPPGKGAVRGARAESPLVRCQDRDELARIVTQGNAALNGLDSSVLRAYTEPLLSGDPGGGWDLILSNIPAKAGEPVLDDFIRRSPALLAPAGRALIVVVAPLADFFRRRLAAAGVSLMGEEQGPEHRVLVYGAGGGRGRAAIPGGPAPFSPAIGEGPSAAYLRRRVRCEMEGLGYDMATVHGAAEFDRPGEGAAAAAKLLRRLGAAALRGAAAPVLIHEGGQGHFPLWFLRFLEQAGEAAPELLVLHGRNILALEAARNNIAAGAPGPALRVVPGVDPALDRGRLSAALGEAAPGAGGCGFIAAFPQAVPRTSRQAAFWEALAALLLPGGLALFGLPAAEADRLDKRKPAGFTRLGDLKRRGFRALAYRRTGPPD